MRKITVLLDKTVGVVVGDQDNVEEGDVVIVTLPDENGMPMKAVGIIEEILEEEDY